MTEEMAFNIYKKNKLCMIIMLGNVLFVIATTIFFLITIIFNINISKDLIKWIECMNIIDFLFLYIVMIPQEKYYNKLLIKYIESIDKKK